MLLFYVLLGAAATVATALCSCFNGLEWLWTLPMLIGYSIGLIILHFLILFIISLFVDKTKEQFHETVEVTDEAIKDAFDKVEW